MVFISGKLNQYIYIYIYIYFTNSETGDKNWQDSL